ncbi:MAG: sulfotransferase, partial [bacterium]|nr:sulfotransferase [bacterium]
MNTSQETHGFPGPLFLIGVSRSGTKLLRDLLNNHSRVGIAMIESKFIPSLYPKYSRWDQEKLKKEFDIFYRDFQGTFFAMSMEEEGNPIDRDAWYRSVAKWTYAGVLEALFKQLAAAGGKTIWGDKTPLHLLY